MSEVGSHRPDSEDIFEEIWRIGGSIMIWDENVSFEGFDKKVNEMYACWNM